jgi:sugar phosphate permease
MRQGRESDVVLGWLAQIETTIDEMPIDDSVSEVALGHWLDEMAVRREGRRTRLAESASTIPGAVWSMLILGAVLTVAYVVVFADRRERWWIQAVMVGSITALIVSGLLVVSFLDSPYQEDGAYIAPTEMQTSARMIQDEVAGAGAQLPCDAEGRPA